MILGNRAFKSPITCFTISERVTGLFFLCCTHSATVQSRRQLALHRAKALAPFGVGVGSSADPFCLMAPKASLGLSCRRRLGASNCERRSGSHRQGRRPSPPQPEGWGDCRSQVSATCFRAARCRARNRPRGVQAAARSPAEGLASGGVGGRKTGSAGRRHWMAAGQQSRQLRTATATRPAPRTHGAAPAQPPSAPRGYFRPTPASWGPGRREAPPFPAHSGFAGTCRLLWMSDM